MKYQVVGYDKNSYLKSLLREIKGKPRFLDGRIDFSLAKSAPVVVAFVSCLGKILLLRRSKKVSNYKGMWNGVAGFLDEKKPLPEKLEDELSEEIGLARNNIARIFFAKPYRFVDREINKTWYIFPAIVECAGPWAIRLDWENVGYKWVSPSQIPSIKGVPNFSESFQRAQIVQNSTKNK